MRVIQLRPEDFGVRARYAVPLVKAPIGGQTCFDATEVPLPPNPSGIADAWAGRVTVGVCD